MSIKILTTLATLIFLLTLIGVVVFSLETRKQTELTSTTIRRISESVNDLNSKLEKLTNDNNLKPKNSENESIKSESSALPSASVESNTTQSTSNSDLKIYTDPVFPDLKIVYPKDWKLTKESTVNGFNRGTDLVFPTITIKKNDSALVLGLRPLLLKDEDCDPKDSIPATKIASFDNGINKFLMDDKHTTGKTIVDYSSLDTYCHVYNYVEPVISSNVQKNNLQDSVVSRLKQDNSSVVNYSIRFYSDNNENGLHIMSDDPLISEIDQIISQSTFK